jgi:hypothetical protein
VAENTRRVQYRSAFWLTVVIAAGWAICFWPARMLRGEAGVAWMTVAAACCLIPGWLVVFLATLPVFRSDLAVMLAQTTVRLVAVGGAAVVVKQLRPEFGPVDFFGWLVGFYCLALMAEVVLLKESNRYRAPLVGSGSQADQENSPST